MCPTALESTYGTLKSSCLWCGNLASRRNRTLQALEAWIVRVAVHCGIDIGQHMINRALG